MSRSPRRSAGLTDSALAALAGLLVHTAGGGVILDDLLMDPAVRSLREARVSPVHPDVAIVGVETRELAAWPASRAGLLRALDLGRAEAAGVLPPLAAGAAGLVLQPPFEAAESLLAGREAPGPSLAPAAVARDPDGGVRRLSPRSAAGRGSLVARLAGSLGVEAGEGRIDYSLGRPFDYEPLDALLRWERAGDWEALEKKLRGRPVLVAPIGEGVARYRVPVNLAGWERRPRDSPEPVVHAQALRTLISGHPITNASPGLTLTLILVAASLAPLTRRLVVAVPATLIAVAALWHAASWLLERGVWLPLSGIALALALGWALRFSRAGGS